MTAAALQGSGIRGSRPPGERTTWDPRKLPYRTYAGPDPQRFKVNKRIRQLQEHKSRKYLLKIPSASDAQPPIVETKNEPF